jgi:hypothetical protein
VTVANEDRRQLAAIGTLHESFESHGVEYWLFGGWAVDFHVGRVTRPHADIDLAVWKQDFGRVDQILRDAGWERRRQPGEDGYTGYAHESMRMDLAFLARDVDGDVYTPLREGRGEWSQTAFGLHLMELDGVRARVVSRSSLVADKTEDRDDPVAAEKDRADVVALGFPPDDG